MQISRIIAQNTCNSMSTNNRQNKPDSLNYIKMPLANYNLKQDTTSFTGFGAISSTKPFGYRRKDTTFDNPVRTRRNIKTYALTAKKEFTAGSVDTDSRPAKFKDVTNIAESLVTGDLTAEGELTAGSVHAGKTRFMDKATVSGHVKTYALTTEGEFTAGSVDSRDTRFMDKTTVSGHVKTYALITEGEFTAGSVNAEDTYIYFKDKATVSGGVTTRGSLTTYKEFTAGNIDAGDTCFKDKTTVSGLVKTRDLTTYKEFTAGNVNAGDTYFQDKTTVSGHVKTKDLFVVNEFNAGSVNSRNTCFKNKTTVSGGVKTSYLVAGKEFTAGSVNTGDIAKFEGITKIAKSLETGTLKTTSSSELTVKNINITGLYQSSILGSLKADSIETTGDLILGKIIKLNKIVINPHNQDLGRLKDTRKVIKKNLTFNSSEIGPDFINIKLGDIYKITVNVPDENTFKKLVFHVAGDVKKGETLWKKLSEVEVAEFIKSGNIVKIIKSVI